MDLFRCNWDKYLAPRFCSFSPLLFSVIIPVTRGACTISVFILLCPLPEDNFQVNPERQERESQFFGEVLQKEAVSKLGVPCVRYRPSVPRSGDRVCAQAWAASCQVFYWDDRWVSQAEMYIPLWYLKCGFFQSRETGNLLPFLLHPSLKVISKFQVGPWCSSGGDRADKLTRVQHLYLQSSSPPVSWACP